MYGYKFYVLSRSIYSSLALVLYSANQEALFWLESGNETVLTLVNAWEGNDSQLICERAKDALAWDPC